MNGDQDHNPEEPVKSHKAISRRMLIASIGMTGAALAAAGYAGFMKPRAANGTPEGAPKGGKEMHYFYTVEEMKRTPALSEGMLLRTMGYYEPGDGGGAEYEVVSGSAPEDGGALIALAVGLQARLLPGGSICYRMFGAVGDAANDDGEQIKRAHTYANRRKLPVINPSGEYWIKSAHSIPIQTSVQWGSSIFHIDESKSTKTNPRFIVNPAKDPVTIELKPDEKAALLTRLKPGTTIIPELAKYKNCMVVVADKNDLIGARSGYEGQNGWAREEFFYVDEHGRILGDLAWTFKNYTSLTAYPCDESVLTVEGGTFLVSGNMPGSKFEGYFWNGFHIKRSRTVIRNQWVGLEPGKTDVSMQARFGFYYFNYVYDVQLENVKLIPWEQDRGGSGKDVSSGTYGIGGARVLNALFRNVTAEGSLVHWGVFGTNLMKNFRLENCRLNRIDVHFHCWNLYISNSEIGYRGISVTGGGDLFIDNSKRYGGGQFLNYRRDFGAKWDGHIRIRNCRMLLMDDVEASILYHTPADFDYKYPIGFGRSIKIEDFVFDYTAVPAAAKPAWIMKLPPFSRIKAGQRLFFPQLIDCSNVIVDGRERGVRLFEIKESGGYWLARKGSVSSDGEVNANCLIKLDNVMLDGRVTSSPEQAADAHFLIQSSAPQEFDEHSLYPSIDLTRCRPVFAHVKGAPADISLQDCTVRGIHATGEAGKPLPGRLHFQRCTFAAEFEKAGADFCKLDTTGGTRFLQCDIGTPVIGGAAQPGQASRYGFIGLNRWLKHNHLHTRLSPSLLHAAGELSPEFAAMLSNHTDAESMYVIKRSGPSAERPAADTAGLLPGYMYFDTELAQQLIWDGNGWVAFGGTRQALYYYLDEEAQLKPGSRMKRSERHPGGEYVMTSGGRIDAYSVALVAGKQPEIAGFELTLLKNGEPWITGIQGELAGNRPAVGAVGGDGRFQPGDRIAVVIADFSAVADTGIYLAVELSSLSFPAV